MTAYYNEHDPFAAAWLRKLIAAGMIAPGDVDERSIEDVIPLELYKYTQCHFFAGIGVWSYAMRCAGWPDDRTAWSGSCPCQPFSQAGEKKGFDDKRHLWPAFFHLIEQCRPATVFGEQVASPDGLAWLDLVQSDMEGTDYAFGAIDQCAAGFGAPHIRQRLYWMADVRGEGLQGRSERRDGAGECTARPFGLAGGAGDANSDGTGRERGSVRGTVNRKNGQLSTDDAGAPSFFSGAEHPDVPSQYGGPPIGGQQIRNQRHEQISGSGACPTNGFWSFTDWLRCKDERWRPVEPGTLPLAYGVTNRMGLLRGYGNAIVAPQAEAFIRAALELTP